MAAAPEKLLLAAPRGYCAGVDRAVQTVERALELYGPPVYVRKEIVHNKHVVEQLRERGAVFVDQETEVPEGETVVFSAHGVSPAVHAQRGRARSLHDDRRHLPARDQGPRGGEEVRRRGLHDRADRPRGPRGGRGHDGRGARPHRAGRDRGGRRRARGRRTRTSVAYLTQTTLSVDETDARSSAGCASASRTSSGRAPTTSVTPPRTARRAVRQMARECDLVLVIGSRNSSNSNRLVEVARDHGADVPPDRQRDPGAARSGSRASAWWASPPARARPRSSSSAWWTSSAPAAPSDVAEFEVVQEDVRFMLPKDIRTALAAQA